MSGTRTAYARNCDITRFERKARRGEIPSHAVTPLARIYAAMRKAQSEIGPGHLPLDAVLESLPPQYVDNYLRERSKKRAA